MIAARFARSVFGSVDSRRLCQSIHALNTFIARSPRRPLTLTKSIPALTPGTQGALELDFEFSYRRLQPALQALFVRQF